MDRAAISGVTTIRTAMTSVVTSSRLVYTANGSAPGAATVGVAVIGEQPYSEGCGDIPTRDNSSMLCLGARLGGEVRAFRRLGALALGVDLEPGLNNRHVLPGDVHALQFADGVFDYAFTNILGRRGILEVVLIVEPEKFEGWDVLQYEFGPAWPHTAPLPGRLPRHWHIFHSCLAGDHEAGAGQVLRACVAANPHGTVLFSTTQPSHLRANVRAVFDS